MCNTVQYSNGDWPMCCACAWTGCLECAVHCLAACCACAWQAAARRVGSPRCTWGMQLLTDGLSRLQAPGEESVTLQHCLPRAVWGTSSAPSCTQRLAHDSVMVCLKGLQSAHAGICSLVVARPLIRGGL